MKPIYYIERTTGQNCEEQVYGGWFLNFLYGNSLLSRWIGTFVAYCLARLSFISAIYGYFQQAPLTARKVIPFIERYKIDSSEFVENSQSFKSFNDFFIRHLKPEARPIDPNSQRAIIPADGRYLFFQNIKEVDGFLVKGQKFDLATLLDSEELASRYSEGAMAIARLCPTDYHRFHFPCDAIPSKTRRINGFLYSVNPIALKKNIHIFTENERTITSLQTKQFGEVQFLEIGATFVGAIHQTYTPFKNAIKGDEKGYFSFGGSSLILLFPPNAIRFDADLLKASAHHTEIRCLMGQSMGSCQ